MKTTGPDDFVDVPLDEIERFSLVQKNRITAADNSGKVSLSHKKEMIKLKLLFGSDPRWDNLVLTSELPLVYAGHGLYLPKFASSFGAPQAPELSHGVSS